MAGENPSFDFRDLAAAAIDSRRLLPAFLSDLIERSSITIERGVLPRQQLPTLHYDVNVPRIKLHAVADPLSHFRCDQRGPGAEERVINQFAVLGVIENRTSHTLDWLLGAVNCFGVLVPILDLPQRTLFAIAIPMSGRTHGVPAWLMLPVIMAAANHERRLCPDDLASDLEMARFQTGGYSNSHQPQQKQTAKEAIAANVQALIEQLEPRSFQRGSSTSR